MKATALILVGLGIILFGLNYLLSQGSKSLSSASPFESGFSTLGQASKIFSLHFFLIMLVFVLFDLELVLILVIMWGGSMMVFLLLGVVLMIYLGLLMEWKLKKLLWSV